MKLIHTTPRRDPDARTPIHDIARRSCIRRSRGQIRSVSFSTGPTRGRRNTIDNLYGTYEDIYLEASRRKTSGDRPMDTLKMKKAILVEFAVVFGC